MPLVESSVVHSWSGGVVVVRLRGAMNGAALPTARAAFAQALRVDGARLVVDLAAVEYGNLEGLLSLVQVSRACADAGRAWQVIPSDWVRRKLELSGLDVVVPIVEDESSS